MSDMYDLHTHTLLSDGELLPIELVRRAAVLGYSVIGITDHVDASNIDAVIASVNRVKDSASEYGVELVCGVELTHIPPAQIAALAGHAKTRGAELVVVHGETTVEPVARGTNRAACSCGAVDILAHPGFITAEEAAIACRNRVALEITGRCGHNRTNGHVLAAARKAGCMIVVNSDAHSPADIMDRAAKTAVARGAGMSAKECREALGLDIVRKVREG